MNPLVSVVIPVYNVEMYLDDCLGSLINQTFEDIEIICVDDGSTDKSLDILKEYASKDNRIKIFSKDNGGPGPARNYGLNKAQGEYLLFLDSDDWLDLNAIEILYETSKSQDLDVLLFLPENYDDIEDRFYEDDYYNNVFLPDSFDETVFDHRDIKEYLFSLAVVPYNKLYKRSVLEKYKIRFPEEVLFEDNPFHYEVLLSARRMSILRKHFVMRRRHEDSITSDVDQKFLDVIKVSNLVLDVFKKYNVFDEYLGQLLNFKMRYISMWYGLIEDEFKSEYWKLMHDDFSLIQDDVTIHNQFLNHLLDKEKNFYLSVFDSNNFQELDFLLLKYQSHLELDNKLKMINREKNNLNNKSKVLSSMEKDILNKNAKVIEDLWRADAKNKILDAKHDNFEKYFAEKKAFLDVRQQELISKQSDFESIILEKNRLFDEMQADFEKYVSQKENELDRLERELIGRKDKFESLMLKREEALFEKERRLDEEFSRRRDFLNLRELELLELSQGGDIRPKISFIVPVFGYDEYVGRCLNSISNQSLMNIEIICVCSEGDDSLTNLKSYADNDSRFKILTLGSKSLAEAREYGFNESSGEYILFMNPSDWFEFDACEDIYMDVKVNNLDLLIVPTKGCSFERELNVFDYQKMGSDMFNIPIKDCQMVYRNDSLKEIPLSDDISIFWEAFLSFNSIMITKEKSYIHREGNLKLDSFPDVMAEDNAVLSVFEKHGLFTQYQSDLNNYRIHHIDQEYSGLVEDEKEDYWTKMREELMRIQDASGDDFANSLDENNKDFYNHVLQSRSFKELDYLAKYD